MNFNRILATTLGAAIGVLAFSAPAEALIGSVKTFGMAATGVAYPQDAEAAMFNPAGAAEIGNRIDMGVAWVRENGHATIEGNILNSIPIPAVQAAIGGQINGKYHGFRTKDLYSGDFGINYRLGACDEWAVGLVVYNRNFVKTTYSQPLVLFGTSNAGLEYLNETVSGVLAYKFNECHSFGLTVNCQVERLKVNGLEKFNNPSPFPPHHPRTVHPGHVSNKGYNWSVGWGVTLGWLWHITDDLTFGATYQPKTSMPKLKKYDGFVAGGRIDIPSMWSVGIAYKYTDCGTIAFDVQQYLWNNVRALNNTLTTSDGVVQPLGAKNGPGFGFKNQTFYRLGIDYMVTCDLTVRAGYRYGDDPFGASQTAVNILTLDTVQHYATIGASYRPTCALELSTFAAYGFEKKINGKGSIPPGQAVSPALARLNPIFVYNPNGLGGGEVNLVESKFILGLSVGYEF